MATKANTPEQNKDHSFPSGMVHKKDRICTIPSLKSKRIMRQRLNKPVYEYKPVILENWTQEDFAKHKSTIGQLGKNNNGSNSSDACVERKVALSYNIDRLKSFMKPEHRSDRWWIVADTKTLLLDLPFIDDLVTQGYPECRLGLPYEILHDLSAMTRRRHTAWVRMPARAIANYIHKNSGSRHKKIIGQSVLEAEDLMDVPEATDSIINYCLQIAKHYYYVVLITDDPERRARALSAKIMCFALDYAKKATLRGNNAGVETNLKITISGSKAPATPAAPATPGIPLTYSPWIAPTPVMWNLAVGRNLFNVLPVHPVTPNVYNYLQSYPLSVHDPNSTKSNKL